jgi:hypothetical protein
MSVSTYYNTGSNLYKSFAFDVNNNMYYATINTIYKVDVNKNETVFSSGYSTVFELLFNHIGFPSDYLYVCDSSFNNKYIYKVDTNGNKTVFFDFSGNPSPDSILQSGVAIDANNNFYYQTPLNRTIYKINTLGVLSLFINGSSISNTINAISFDAQDNMYITQLNKISKYDISGNLITNNFFTTTDTIVTNLIFNNTNVYIATFKTGLNRYVNLSKYDLNGNFLETIYILNNVFLSSFILNFDSDGNLFFGPINPNIIYEYPIGSGPIPPTPSPIPCFKEDTNILTNKGYLPIQHLKIGDYIKTSKHGYVPISMIGHKNIQNPGNQERIPDRLYVCAKEQFPELLEDLVITGRHALLVDSLTEEEEKETEKVLEKIYMTEDKYRLPACVDTQTIPYEKEGDFKVYHIALQNRDANANYGIYANGLLVESCSANILKYMSNMTVVEGTKLHKMRFV